MEKIEIFETNRPCEGTFDKSSLALKEVDNSINNYSNKIILLSNADIIRIVTPGGPADIDAGQSKVERKYSFGLELSYRQEWKPSGYGLGEIIQSITLLPNEELSLEVKTWETSKTQQEDNIQLDSKNISDIQNHNSDAREVLDDYQEKTKHTLDTKASANWGWGSCDVSYGFSKDVQNQHKTLTKQMEDVTTKSINEISSKKSIKMAVSREIGSEEKTTRKIKNINQCRTLTANFYQVLKEYEVNTYVDDVKLILFGMDDMVENWERYVNAKWDLEGIIMQSLREYSLDDDNAQFELKVAPNVFPRVDLVCENPKWKYTWGAVGASGKEAISVVRYAFEVMPGFENGFPKGLKELLDYLYSFVSTSSPPEYMKDLKIINENELQKNRNYLTELLNQNTVMLIPESHFLANVPPDSFPKVIAKTEDNIIKEFLLTRETIGKLQISSKHSIPSHGIYAETMLGVCSGCEDYFEVQRQFDLEKKKLEIEKLKLELDKLKIENEALNKGRPNLLINNSTDDTSLNLNISSSEKPFQVDIQKP